MKETRGTDSNPFQLSRRNFTQALGSATVGGMVLSQFTGTVEAANSWHWDNKQSVYPYTHHLSTSLDLLSSEYVGDDSDESGFPRWRHTFHFCGDAACTDSYGDETGDMERNIMKFRQDDPSGTLETYYSPDKNISAAYPEKGNEGSGDEFGLATDALNVAAEFIEDQYSFALSAGQLAAAMLNYFGDIGTEPDWEQKFQTIYNRGQSQTSHHTKFIVDSYDYSATDSPNMVCLSQCGGAEIYVTINFYYESSPDPGRGRPSSSSTSTTYEFGDPRDMTVAEREHFGVTKVPISEIPNPAPEALESGKKEVWRATNPPIEAEQTPKSQI